MVRSGARSFEVGNGKGATILGITWALATDYFIRAYVWVDTAPSAAESLFTMSALAAGAYNVRLNADLTLTVRAGASTIGSTTVPLLTGQWYRIEWHWRIDSGSSDDSVELMVDGVTLISELNATRATSAPTSVQVGSGLGGSTSVVYVDDLAVNDNSGTSQNSWPGAGKVVLLIPASDNAVGAGWTLGTGTAIASNAFDSVNNQPPTGVADLAVGSDPKQIRNASANANTSYDANLTTYTAAGISALDLINVAVPVVATAAPVTTSAKAGTVGMVSNPAITNVALGAAGTAGAFWQGNTGGTFPAGWKISYGTTTYAPSVSVATAPVARITQVTSSTRIAMVSALGLYVDYLPGGLSPPPPVHIPFMR